MTDSNRNSSGISRKYPTYRKSKIITVPGWVKGKQLDDGAEGLWRIYDTLYDFTDFIDHHPGGAYWLKATKGTDITEPFESHHISVHPFNIIKQYKIRDASSQRNYQFTFHEDGFYKTLKRRVRDELQNIDLSSKRKSNMYLVVLLMATFVLAVANVITKFIGFGILAALALAWLTVASHNYFHQRDNWQMYCFNFSLMNFVPWRISHAISHHVYPNSLHDLEMSMFEPFLCWIPDVRRGSKFHRWISIMIQPFVYCLIGPAQFTIRVFFSFLQYNVMYWHDILGFFLPAVMYFFASDATPYQVLQQWIFIILLSSFIFAIIGLNAAHHDPKIYHDGDAYRADRDWGLFQVDTIIDRSDIKGSQFLVLTHFGDHALHHLFPTIDHGILSQLYPIFIKTLKEFDTEMRYCNHFQHILGQNKQLLRVTTNKIPPGKDIS